MLPVSPDSALFDYMAWLRIKGGHYYADVAEQNWPGIVFIHELGIRLFGVHFWTYRLTDFICLQISCFGLFLFLKRCGFSIAPFIVLALYPPLYITAGIWMAGQRDIVATQFLILGTALLLVEPRKTPFAKLQVISAGLIMAEAVLIRPTYLAYIPFALAVQWLLSNRTSSLRLSSYESTALFSLGLLGLLSIVLLWGVYSQNLDDWYEQTITFNLVVYATPISWTELINRLVQWILNSWHWIVLFAALGLALWIRSRSVVSELLYVAGLGATILLSYFVQRKGFIYHASGLLPIFAALIAVALDELWKFYSEEKQPRRLALLAAFLFVVVVTIVGTTSKLRTYQPMVSQISTGRILPVDVGEEVLVMAEVHMVADYIRMHSDATDYILQWGRAFHVGFLAQRQPSSRFISTPALNIITPTASRMQPWLDEFSKSINQKKPKFVVLSTDNVTTQKGQLMHAGIPSNAMAILFDFLSNGYVAVYQGKSLILLEAE